MSIHFIDFSLPILNVNYIPCHGMAPLFGYQNIDIMVPKMLEFLTRNLLLES